MIQDINKNTLHRYIEMRQKLDVEAKTIQSLASLLAMFQHCGDDKLEIDPAALGFIHQIIEKSILNIWEILDDFIYIIEARQVLADLSKLDSGLCRNDGGP